MPDLDLIKQEEHGGAGPAGVAAGLFHNLSACGNPLMALKTPHPEGGRPFETPPAAAPQDKAAVSKDTRQLNPGTRRFAQGCGVEDRSSFNLHGRVLLQICCRCSHWQQSVQFMIAGPWSRRIAEDRVLHLVAGRDAEACRGAAVQLDDRANRCAVAAITSSDCGHGALDGR